MVYKRGGRGNEDTTDTGASRGRSKKLSVAYTNIDGLLSSVLEVRDYLKEKRPDVMCIVDTKIKNEINASFINEGYESWRRDRKEKGGGGVLILVRDNISV